MKKINILLLLLSVSLSVALANKTVNLSVKGMHCGGCEVKFKSTATKIDGVQEVSAVSAANSNATIIYDEKTTTEEKLIAALAEKTGYTIAVAANAGTTVAGKPAGCCMSGKSNPSCKSADKQKCSKQKSKCTKD